MCKITRHSFSSVRRFFLSMFLVLGLLALGACGTESPLLGQDGQNISNWDLRLTNASSEELLLTFTPPISAQPDAGAAPSQGPTSETDVYSVQPAVSDNAGVAQPEAVSGGTARIPAGGRLDAELFCGRVFAIMGGVRAEHITTYPPPASCPGRSETALLAPAWQVRLDNSRNFAALSLQVSEDTAGAIQGSPAEFNQETDTLSVPPGEVLEVFLRCGAAFGIVAGGTARNTQATDTLDTPAEAACRTRTATEGLFSAEVVLDSPTWSLLLDNRANSVELTLQRSQAAADGGDPTEELLSVAAGAQTTLTLLCGADFQIVDGGTADNTEGISSPDDCLDDDKRETLALTPPPWRVQLAHGTQAGVPLTVDQATAAAITQLGETQYAAGEAPATFSVPPAGLEATLNSCNQPFAFAEPTDASPVRNTEPIPAVCDGSLASAVLQVASWSLTLRDDSGEGVTLNLAQAVAANSIYTDLGGLSGSQITIAPGEDAILQLLCNAALEITEGPSARTIRNPHGDGCAARVAVTRTVNLAPRTWELRLSNPTAVPLSLKIAGSTARALQNTPVSFTTDTFTLVPGASSSATLFCGVSFEIVAGGSATNGAETIAPPDTCASGSSSKSLALTSPTWQVRLSNPTAVELSLKIHGDTAAALQNTPDNFATDTFTLAPGASSSATLFCGIGFQISGGTAANTGSTVSPDDCADSGKFKAIAFSAPAWQLTLTNSTQASVPITVDTDTAAAITQAGSTLYTGNAPTAFAVPPAGLAFTLNSCEQNFAFAAPTPSTPVRNASFSARCAGTPASQALNITAWTLTLHNDSGLGLTLSVSPAVAAGSIFTDLGSQAGSQITLAGGADAVLKLLCNAALEITEGAAGTPTLSNPGDCTAAATHTANLTPPTWTVQLSNPTAVLLSLKIAGATATALQNSPVSFATDTFTLAPLGGASTVSLPCGVSFEIVAGGTATNAAATIAPPDTCTNGGTSKPLAFASPTWTVVLSNPTAAQLTLVVTQATARAIASITQNPPGYSNGTFTLGASGSSSVELPCGVNFDVTGGTAANGDDSADRSSPATATACAGGSQDSSVTLAAPTWTVQLSNPTAVELTLQVDSTTAAAVVDPPQGFTDTFTLAPLGGASIASLPCGVNFEIVAGGTATNAAATIAPPDTCTNGGTSKPLAFASPTWTVVLSNPTAARLSLQIHGDTAAALQNNPNNFVTDTFTLGAGATSSATLFCGVNFRIIAGGSATNGAATIAPPNNCTAGSSSKPLAFTSPTWQVRLSNPTAVQLSLKIHSTTATALQNTPDNFATDTFTLGPGAISSATLFCGVGFQITGGTATNTRETIAPPGNCTAGSQSKPLAFASPTWELRLSNSTRIDLTLQVAQATERAFVGDPARYTRNDNTFSLRINQDSIATLPCGVGFQITGGTATNGAQTIAPPATCTDGGSSKPLAFASPTWTVALSNPTAVQLTLVMTQATADAIATITQSPAGYSNGTFTLAATTGSSSVELPCGVDFDVTGGTATNGNDASDRTAPTTATACAGGSEDETVTLAAPTWTVALSNPTAVQLTLVVTPATATAIATISQSPPGYSNGTFTLAATTGASSVELPCGVNFDVRGGTAANVDTADRTAPTIATVCEGGSQDKSVTLAAPTWEVRLSNANAVDLTLQVHSDTADAVANPPDGFTDTFTLAELTGAFAVELPCGVGFQITGGTATNTGTIGPPGGCTAGSTFVNLPLIAATWQVVLDNSANAIDLTVRVSGTTASRLINPSSYDSDNDLFTVPKGQPLMAALMLCGRNFRIVLGGTALNPEGNVDSPANCENGGKSGTADLISPTWEVRLSNANAVELTLQVAQTTEDAFGDTTPAHYTTADNTFTLAMSESSTATLPCGVGFEIVSGGTATNTGTIAIADSRCDDRNKFEPLVFTVPSANPTLNELVALTPTGTAGNTATRTYRAFQDGRVFVYTTGATDEIEIEVRRYGVEVASDDDQLGVRSNAAVAFDATAGETYTLKFTNISATDQGIFLHAGTAALITTGVTAVAMGPEHSCFLLNTRAYCVGNNGSGKLGRSSLATTDALILLREIDSLGSGVSVISAGEHHTCAIQSGRAYCWGLGYEGRLGHGGSADKNTPTAVYGLGSGVTAISAGRSHTCAIHVVSSNAAAKCWGGGGAGQIGNGEDDTLNSLPVQVNGLTSGVTAIGTGFNHTCAIHSGAAKCWGSGRIGQRGDGSTGFVQTTPVQVSGLGSGVTAISAGSGHTCAIHNNRAKCWGSGSDGQLGNGTNGNTICASRSVNNCSLTPVQVSGLTSGATAISAADDHTCAIHSGIAKCWGDGNDGVLGNGSNIIINTPVTVSLPVGFVPATLSQGYYTRGSCAMTSGGRPECWGSNSIFRVNSDIYRGYGTLGDGGNEDRNTPVPVYDSSGF